MSEVTTLSTLKGEAGHLLGTLGVDRKLQSDSGASALQLQVRSPVIGAARWQGAAELASAVESAHAADQIEMTADHLPLPRNDRSMDFM
jgi:hypothetical protein